MRAKRKANQQTTTAADGHRARSDDRAPDAIPKQTGYHTAQRTAANHQERSHFSQSWITSAQRQTRANHERNPRPHRVQLPHVAEVAEAREPNAAVPKNLADLAPVKSRARQSQRTFPDEKQNQQRSER